MVFHIAEPEGGKWKPRWLAHTGIAEQTVEDFYLHQAAVVIHMGFFISKDIWSGGVTEDESRVDACGTRPDLDDLTRDEIMALLQSVWVTSGGFLRFLGAYRSRS